MTRQPSSRLVGLDLLRAAAIVAVVIPHGLLIFLIAPSGRTGFETSALFRSVAGGSAFLGVEWFFVLSGFLVGGILLRLLPPHTSPSGRSIISFLMRRWLRTLPNYYLFLVVNAFILLLIGAPGLSVTHLFFAQNLAWPLPSHSFAESWSLAVEEWFYLLLPILAAAFLWLTKRRDVAILGTILALVMIPILARMALVDASHDPATWDRLVHIPVVLHFDGLGWGVLAAWWSWRWPTSFRKAAGSKALFGLSAVAASALAFATIQYAGDWPLSRAFAHATVFPLGSVGVVLLLPLLASWKPSPAVARPIMRVSLVSYSWYLCHVPLGLLLARSFGVGLREPMAALGAWIAWVALSFVLANVVYEGFERPILDFRDRRIARTARV